MEKTTLLFLCLLTVYNFQAQQKAVTEKGEEVILFDDGTWVYQNEEVIEESEIPTNPKEFEKDEKSTFLLKSNKLKVGFWLDPKIWSFTKSTSNPAAEYEFQLKDEDLQAMVISEKIEIPLDAMPLIALENGKAAAPDLKIVNQEYRTVNGLKVLFLKMNGTMYGIKFSYYGYYYSNISGTVQFLIYTSQNLLDSYRRESEMLLNGLVELN